MNSAEFGDTVNCSMLILFMNLRDLLLFYKCETQDRKYIVYPPVSLFDAPSTRVQHRFFNLLFLFISLLTLPAMPPLPIIQAHLPADLRSWSLSHCEVISWTASCLAQLS